MITHQGEKTKVLSDERRNTCLACISRADLSTEKQKNIGISSDHFVSGKLAALYDKTKAGWVTSLYLGHEKFKVPASSSLDRYTRALNRKRQGIDEEDINVLS